jgi:hypothetical protein
MMTHQDRWFARRLPDEFLARPGDPVDRIRPIVARTWWEHDEQHQAALVKVLASGLHDLLRPGTTVTDRHRSYAEHVVASWLAP